MKFWKTVFALANLLVLGGIPLLCETGCGSRMKHPFLGAWESEPLLSEGGHRYSLILVLDSDGEFRLRSDQEVEGSTFDVRGSYEVHGTNLVLRYPLGPKEEDVLKLEAKWENGTRILTDTSDSTRFRKRGE